MRLRVLTFNVQHDAGDPRRTGLVNRELRRLGPDLVAFQEVCYPDGWDQLAELVAGTGLHTTHQAGVLDYLPPDADRYGGTAVATRWPHRVVEVLGERPVAGSHDHDWTLAVSVRLPGLGEQLLIVPTTAWRLDAEAARSARPCRSASWTRAGGRRCPRSSPATSTPPRRRPASGT